ncbi:MAG: hypothetical protein QXD31_03870 [Candidatus Caldarchaeum sp.]
MNQVYRARNMLRKHLKPLRWKGLWPSFTLELDRWPSWLGLLRRRQPTNMPASSRVSRQF